MAITACSSLNDRALYQRRPLAALIKWRSRHGCRRAILFVGPAHDDPERVIRQWPLQRLSFVPRRAHPDVALVIGRQDDRHGLWMDRRDDRIRRRGQKAIDVVRAGGRLRFRATIAFEFGPMPAKPF